MRPRPPRRGVLLGILLVVVLAALGWANPGAARSSGTIGEVAAVIRGTPITIYTYRPAGCTDPELLFVFHGNSRAAESYRNSALPLADRACLLVFAPLFDAERFPNWSYHRGGVIRNGEVRPQRDWTVAAVADLVRWARQREGRPQARYYLFGFSAGGQFLSRVAAYGPPIAPERIVIGNPSTQVLPTTEEDAPYGMGALFPPGEETERLRDYLAQPITLYLGLDDTGQEDLTRNAGADRQGDNRLDRGRKTFALAERVARENGWFFGWQLVEVPGLGHSAGDALAADAILGALNVNALETLP